MVATSRERLRLPGEQVRVVPTLPVTDDGSAVQLFMERARAVVPGFAPAGDDLACLAEIVRRLAGLPLAIELTDARLHTHSLAAVPSAPDRRFSLLAAGRRAPSRHASLVSVLSSSFDHLSAGVRPT